MDAKDKPSNLGRCSGHFYDSLLSVESESVKRVLDIGCGDGRTFYLLKRFPGAARFGMDINIKKLRKAKDKCFAVFASGLKTPFKGEAFDLAVEFHTFHHIPDFQNAIKETARCLKTGGHFLMVEAVNDNPVFKFLRNLHPITKDMPIESNFTFNELKRALSADGLEVIRENRFGTLFEFTLGGIPGVPDFIKKATSAADSALEKMFGTKHCASCVVLARKK